MIYYPTPVDIVLKKQKKYPDFNFEYYLKKQELKEQERKSKLKKEVEDRKKHLAKKI